MGMMENPVFHFMGEFRVYFFNNSLLFHFSDSILLVCVKFFDSHLSRFFSGGCKDSLQAGRSDSLRQKPFSRSTHGESVNAAAKGLLNIFGASSGYPLLDTFRIEHLQSASSTSPGSQAVQFSGCVVPLIRTNSPQFGS